MEVRVCGRPQACMHACMQPRARAGSGWGSQRWSTVRSTGAARPPGCPVASWAPHTGQRCLHRGFMRQGCWRLGLVCSAGVVAGSAAAAASAFTPSHGAGHRLAPLRLPLWLWPPNTHHIHMGMGHTVGRHTLGRAWEANEKREARCVFHGLRGGCRQRVPPLEPQRDDLMILSAFDSMCHARGGRSSPSACNHHANHEKHIGSWPLVFRLCFPSSTQSVSSNRMYTLLPSPHPYPCTPATHTHARC